MRVVAPLLAGLPPALANKDHLGSFVLFQVRGMLAWGWRVGFLACASPNAHTSALQVQEEMSNTEHSF